MSDAKLLDLPGIKTGEQEVFETPDVPLHTGLVEPLPEESAVDEIDTNKLDPQKSFAIFKGKELSARGPSARTANRTVFDSESPAAKLARMQQEMAELMQEIDIMHTANEKSEFGDSGQAVEMKQQLTLLQKQLHQVRMDKSLGEFSPFADLRGQQTQITNKLFGEIEKLKQGKTDSGSSSTTSSTAAIPGTIVYELMYRPETARFNEAARYAELEGRVAALERLVGVDGAEQLATSVGVPNANLCEVVCNLSTRVNALSEENLCDIDRRLQTLLAQLDAVKAKDSEQPAEYAAKINDLYELGKRWDSVAGALPEIVERMHSLRVLHEQGADFAKTLTHLETVQSSIKGSLSTHGSTLKTVEESLQKNTATIEANIKALEQRLQKLNA